MSLICKPPFIFEELAKTYPANISIFFTLLEPSIPIIYNAMINMKIIPVFHSASNRAERRQRAAFMNSLPNLERNAFYPVEKQKKIFELFYKNQATRFYLKKFLFIWRFKKWSNRQINIEDPVTLFPPDKPIKLFDPSSNGFYVFDPTTLLKHIHKSLLNHHGVIDEPIFPKNPFTNLRFSLGQLISLYHSFLSIGMHHWVFNLFRTSQFSLGKLQNIHKYSLKKAALESTLNDKTSYQFQDFLLEFIRQEYEELDERFREVLYRWAVEHNIESQFMQEWVKLAKESAIMDIEWECLNEPMNIPKINKKAAEFIFDDLKMNRLNQQYFAWQEQNFSNITIIFEE